jgi:hypothetical protein
MDTDMEEAYLEQILSKNIIDLILVRGIPFFREKYYRYSRWLSVIP